MNKILIFAPIIALVSIGLGVTLFLMMEGDNQTVFNNAQSTAIGSEQPMGENQSEKQAKKKRQGFSLTDAVGPGVKSPDSVEDATKMAQAGGDVASATGDIGSATGTDNRQIASGSDISSVTRMAPDGTIMELSPDGTTWIKSPASETEYSSGDGLALADATDGVDSTGSTDPDDDLSGNNDLTDTDDTNLTDTDATPTYVPDGERASISGTVRNLEGEPVSGASVKCQMEESYPGAEGVGANMGNGVTDETGRYTIGGLAAGRHSVTARGPSGDVDTTYVTLSPGQDLSGVDFQLEESGGNIEGRVTDAQTGQPISGVVVTAEMESSSYHAGDIVEPAQTDGSGIFVIQGLLANSSYKVTASARSRGYADVILNNQSVPTMGLEIQLSKGVPVSGHVYYDETTDPVSQATVTAKRSGENMAEATTNESGFYEFEALAPGNYELEAYTQDQISRTKPLTIHSDSQGMEGIDLTIRPAGGFIGITIDPRKSPIEGATVWLYKRRDMQFKEYRTSLSGQGGEFQFLALPGGTYYFSAEKEGLGRLNYSEHYSIGDSEVLEDITLELPKAAVIGGRVTDGQMGLPGVRVQVVNYSQNTTTNHNGEFELSDLDSNWTTVDLQFSKEGYETGRENGVSVGTTDLEKVLQGGGEVSGTVTDKNSRQPVVAAKIVVEVHDLGGGDTYYDPSPRYTDNSGHYSVKGVPLQHNFTVIAEAQNYEKTEKSDFMPLDGQKMVDFQLIGGITVEGVVKDAETQQGIPDVNVTAQDQSAYTNFEGVFKIDGVPEGKPPFKVQESTNYGSYFRPIGSDEDYDVIHFLNVNRENNFIQLEMRKGVTIYGKITNREGNPISGARVSEMSSSLSAQTGGDGMYRLSGLPEGTGLRLVIAADGYEEKWMNPQEFTFTTPEEELNWTLLRGGTVRGNINLVSGNDSDSAINLYDIHVKAHCIQPADPRQIEYNYKDVKPLGGIYTLPHLTPGTYQVEVWQRLPNLKKLNTSGQFSLGDEQVFEIPGSLDIPF